MKIKTGVYIFTFVLLLFTSYGCVTKGPNCCNVKTKTITVYEDHEIPANMGISTGVYTAVDGYRYINIAVEFEQNTANENAVSLGVVFAHSQNGKMGSRRYFTFDENFSGPADPQMITITGKSSWHGQQHGKSSYTARLPVMGPFMQVFPFNHHDDARKISVVLYLVE